jgi:signal transduction histidine kinase
VAISVSIAYYTGAQVGLALTFQPHPVSTLWPPNAILFAALLLSPKRWWWLILLAVFPAHLLVQLSAGIPLTMILCWFVSNCSEALISAWVLRYFTTDVRLDRTYDVWMFTAVSFVGVFLSSFLDVAFVMLNRFGESSYWVVFRMRLFSNLLACLTLVPVIVTWNKSGFRSLLTAHWSRYVEAALLAGGLVLVGIVSFGTQRAGQNTTPALLYLPLPLLLWGATRFGPRGSSTALLAVSFFAIWGAVHGIGPFVTQSPEMNALSVQLFLILASMPVLLLGALIKERELAQQIARQKEKRLESTLAALHYTSEQNRAILRALPDLVFLLTTDGIYLDYYTRDTNQLFVSPDQFLGKSVRDVLPPDFAEQVMQSLVKTKNTDEPQILEYSLTMGDEQRHYEARMIRIEGDKVLSIVRDVTDRQRASLALKDSQVKLRHTHNQIRELLGRLIDVQESERRRISRELHDDLSQKIATLSVGISRLKKKLPIPERQLIAELDQLREDTSNLTNEIRALSHQLHPAVLEHLGLVAALESFVRTFKNEEEIDVTLTADIGDNKIPFQTSICMYRVAVEALRNVSRHSGALAASVSLKTVDGVLELKVSDSGKGFDVEFARKGEGLGLVSIEERLRLLMGSCVIHSDARHGTTLVARVPLPR